MLKGTRDGGLVTFGFHRKVIERGLHSHLFQFHEGAKTRKNVIALRPHGLCRRLGKRAIALEGFVILFPLPPFWGEGRNLVCGQCGIAAYQRKNADTVVRVCADLLAQQEQESPLPLPNSTSA